MTPSRSAAARAGSSTTAPRAVLTRVAVGFIRAELAGADQVVGLRGQRRVEAEDVAGRQQLVEVEPGRLELGRVRRVVAREVGDLHAEGAAAGGDARADPAEADDPEPAAAQVVADHEVEAPGPGSPGADQPLPLAQPAAGGEDQGEGEVGGGVVEDAGRVGDDDPAPRAGREVDVVEADGDVADAAQLRPGGVEELVVDAVVEHRQATTSAPATRARSSSRESRPLAGPLRTSPTAASISGARPGSAAVVTIVGTGPFIPDDQEIWRLPGFRDLSRG